MELLVVTYILQEGRRVLRYYWGSTAGSTLTMLGGGWPRIQGSNPSRNQGFFSSAWRPDLLWNLPESYSMDNVVQSSPGENWPVLVNDRSPPSSAEFRNGWSSIPLPIRLQSWLLTEHSVTFILFSSLIATYYFLQSPNHVRCYLAIPVHFTNIYFISFERCFLYTLFRMQKNSGYMNLHVVYSRFLFHHLYVYSVSTVASCMKTISYALVEMPWYTAVWSFGIITCSMSIANDSHYTCSEFSVLLTRLIRTV